MLKEDKAGAIEKWAISINVSFAFLYTAMTFASFGLWAATMGIFYWVIDQENGGAIDKMAKLISIPFALVKKAMAFIFFGLWSASMGGFIWVIFQKQTHDGRVAEVRKERKGEIWI